MNAQHDRITGQYLDSRDLIAFRDDVRENPLDFDDDDRTRADEIDQLESAGIPDWEYGAQLIREDHFAEYAQELAEDVGAIGRDMQWPLMHIDWEAAADALKIDYMDVQYDDSEYFVRA